MNLSSKIIVLKKLNSNRLERVRGEVLKKNSEVQCLQNKRDDLIKNFSNLQSLSGRKQMKGIANIYSINEFLRKKSVIQQQLNNIEAHLSLIDEQLNEKLNELATVKEKQKMILIKFKKLDFHHEKHRRALLKSELQLETNLCEELIYGQFK